MRLSYVVLPAVIAVTFASSGYALATTFGRNTELSAMTPPNAVASIGGEKRSLRYHNNADLEKESGDEGLLEKKDAEYEEERKGTNMFSTTKLDEMLDGTQLMSRFKKWKKAGYNPYNLPDEIQVSKYDELRVLYRNYVYHKTS